MAHPPPAAVQTRDPAPVDLTALKARQQGAWSSGDYAVVGTTLQIVGEELCEALDLRAGQKVLDVAAGNGNVSLAAARRWCDVVATDYVPALLERAPRARRRRAARHRVPRGRRGSAAVRRRQLRRGRLDLRRDVHARPGARRRRAASASAGAAARSASPTGRRRASSASCSRPSASTCRRRPARGRRRCGARARGSPSCSSRTRPRSSRRSATSCSAIARRSIGWRSSGPTTARCSRPSPRSSRPAQAALAARPHGADRPVQPLGRRHHGRAERVPRNRHHAALIEVVRARGTHHVSTWRRTRHETRYRVRPAVVRSAALSLAAARRRCSPPARCKPPSRITPWCPPTPSNGARRRRRCRPARRPPSCSAARPRRGRSCCGSSFPPASSSRRIVIPRTSSSPSSREGSRSASGEKVDREAIKPLPPASFVHLPAGMPHYAYAEGETVVQINGMGPFDVIYIDPKDDPRKK